MGRLTNSSDAETGEKVFQQDEQCVTNAMSQPAEPELSFRVDLWNETRSAVERVLARASGPALAHAIFAAARREYPGRYLTLSNGQDTIATAE
jgi:hypothetical protein